MKPHDHARDLFLRLSAINPEHVDDIAELLVASFKSAINGERERCASIAEHLNGWGNPPAPELAEHIAKVIRGR